MRRRTVVLGGIAASLVHKATAATRTLIQSANGPINRVYVQTPTIIRQDCPQWCWAASASMVFAMHGHPLDQMKIVPRVFGGVVCMPAPSGITIATVLNEP